MKQSLKLQTLARNGGGRLVTFTLILVSFCFLTDCYGQGTTTFTFEGQPVGTLQQLGSYIESERRFQKLGPGSLYLSGGAWLSFQKTGRVTW